MGRRIDEDHKAFHDVYAGKKRKALQKYINNGKIFPKRGKNGKVNLTIPRIDIPHIVYGDSNEGVGRGPGKEGDVVGKKDQQGQGKGNKAGQDEGEGIEIQVDMEEVWKAFEEELQLPAMKPKPNQTFEDVIIKYNDISINGPESLRHNRRTLLQAMKRMCSTGDIHKLHYIPGFDDPMRLILPINSDKRYRQYKEIKVPSNKAVIFFARDGSASMTQDKCDIISDMAWWIDSWIRRFYDKVERCYVWHDTAAQEVDEKKFYRYRYGGGTTCSSALKLIQSQFENRYPPNTWNIYLFYFTDGENWDGDNEIFCKVMEEQMPENIVNLIGITQVLGSYSRSLKEFVDSKMHGGNLSNVKTTLINNPNEIGVEMKEAIVKLLGAKNG